jgi:hypothetical protein
MVIFPFYAGIVNVSSITPAMNTLITKNPFSMLK